MNYRMTFGLAVVAVVAVVGMAQFASADLLAHYTFDDSNDIGFDSAGGHDGFSWGLDSFFSSDAVLGAGSVGLDGTGIGLQVGGQADFETLTSFTMAAYVKPDFDDPNFGTLGRIFGSLGIDEFGVQFGQNAGYGFGVFSDGRLRYTTYGIQDYDQAATVQEDTWQHVAVSINEGDATFYLNGSNLGTIVGGNPTVSIANWFHIGASGIGSTEPFVGLIDDLRIYDSALSGSEIIDLLPPGPVLTIDRTTGATTLTNEGTPISITGYTMTSGVEALDADAWSSIAENYDADSGPPFFDPNNTWTETSSTTGDLSEGTTGSAVYGTGISIDLGELWIQSPNEDVLIELTLDDLSTVTAIVLFTGNNDQPLAVGDLTFDGQMTAADWAVYQAGMRADLSALSQAQAYQMGDLDADGDNDLIDFGIFRSAYDAQNGAGAFAAMIAGVPEPSSVLLLTAGIAMAVLCARSPRRRSTEAVVGRIGTLALISTLLVAATAQAQLTPVFEYSFPASYDGDGSPASNVITDLSAAGNHGTMDTSDRALIDNRPPGFDPSLMSMTGANGNHGATNAVDLLDNALVEVAGGFTMDVWFQWDGVWSDSRKLLDYAGTEALRTNAGTLEFRLNSAAEVVSTPIVAETWYHAVATFDTLGNTLYEAGDANSPNDPDIDGLMSLYLDDILVGNLEATLTGFGDALDRPIGINRWAGGGGEWNQGFIFNPSIYLGVADIVTPTLTLEVDTISGDVMMRNDSGEAIDINAYEILSDGGALDASGWNPIQGESGFPAGDGSGNGWETSGTPSSGFLGEAYLTGDSTFADLLSLNLGSAFDTSVFGSGNEADLEFNIRRADGLLVAGLIEYVMSGYLQADFNEDGSVDGDDFLVWQGGFGQFNGDATKMNGDANDDGFVDGDDFLVWQTQFGSGDGSAAGAVPEPTTLATACLLMASLACGSSRRRQRKQSCSVAPR